MTTKVTAAIAAVMAAFILAPAALAVPEVPGDAGFVITGSRTTTGLGVVRVRSDENIDGIYEHVASDFLPYGTAKVGEGVRVATGDFNGDGNDELVVAAGNGLPVKIYQLNTDGTIGDLVEARKLFGQRGVFVASGDLNGDGRFELIAGAASGKPGLVRVYSDTNLNGRVLDNQTDSFTAFAPGFKGGVTVASGNTNNTPGDEVIAGMASNGRQVKIWTDVDLDRAVSDGPALESFFAYPSSHKGGVNLAAGTISNAGGGGAELMTAPASGKRKVVIWTDSNGDGRVADNPRFESFSPNGSNWAGGIRLAAGDTDHSGFLVELVTSPGASSNKQKARIWDDSGDAGSFLHDNPVTQTFKPAPGSVKAAGTWVAFGVVRSATYAFPGLPQFITELSALDSEFWVPPSAGRIRDLDVFMDIFHAFDGDLDVTLTHVSSGTSLVLFNDVGGTNEGFLIRLTDEAGTDIGAATNPKLDGPISGTFNPQGAALLSVFDGLDASGLWRLTIVDDSAGDTGVLHSWGLIVTN